MSKRILGRALRICAAVAAVGMGLPSCGRSTRNDVLEGEWHVASRDQWASLQAEDLNGDMADRKATDEGALGKDGIRHESQVIGKDPTWRGTKAELLEGLREALENQDMVFRLLENGEAKVTMTSGTESHVRTARWERKGQQVVVSGSDAADPFQFVFDLRSDDLVVVEPRGYAGLRLARMGR